LAAGLAARPYMRLLCNPATSDVSTLAQPTVIPVILEVVVAVLVALPEVLPILLGDHLAGINDRAAFVDYDDDRRRDPTAS
jgi:hypothetical protein